MSNPNTHSGIRKYVWRYVDEDVAYPHTLHTFIFFMCILHVNGGMKGQKLERNIKMYPFPLDRRNARLTMILFILF